MVETALLYGSYEQVVFIGVVGAGEHTFLRGAQ